MTILGQIVYGVIMYGGLAGIIGCLDFLPQYERTMKYRDSTINFSEKRENC